MSQRRFSYVMYKSAGNMLNYPLLDAFSLRPISDNFSSMQCFAKSVFVGFLACQKFGSLASFSWLFLNSPKPNLFLIDKIASIIGETVAWQSIAYNFVVATAWYIIIGSRVAHVWNYLIDRVMMCNACNIAWVIITYILGIRLYIMGASHWDGSILSCVTWLIKTKQSKSKKSITK